MYTHNNSDLKVLKLTAYPTTGDKILCKVAFEDMIHVINTFVLG